MTATWPASHNQDNRLLRDEWCRTRQVDNYSTHIVAAFRIGGALDVPRLAGALRSAAKRHPALCSQFARADTGEHDSVFRQAPAPSVDPPCVLEDVETWDHEAVLYDEVLTPIPRESAPRLRMRVAPMPSNERVVVLSVDHLACDGWGWALLLDEISAAYNGVAHGDGEPQDAYGRWSQDERERLSTPEGHEALARWREHLGPAGPLPRFEDLAAPDAVAPRPALGGMRELTIDSDVFAAARHVARAATTTPPVVWLAAFCALMRGRTRSRSIGVLCPVAQRTNRRLRGAIGWYADILVVAAHLDASMRLSEAATAVHRAYIEAGRLPRVPWAALIERLDPELHGKPVPHPVLMFNFTPRAAAQGLVLDGATVRPVEVPRLRVPPGIGLEVEEGAAGGRLRIVFQRPMTSADEADRILQDVRRCLLLLHRRPDMALDVAWSQLASADEVGVP